MTCSHLEEGVTGPPHEEKKKNRLYDKDRHTAASV